MPFTRLIKGSSTSTNEEKLEYCVFTYCPVDEDSSIAIPIQIRINLQFRRKHMAI